MPEISRITVPQATEDPESAFKDPRELVDHPGLTRGQKIAALERWCFGVTRRLESVSEGLRFPEGANVRDAELHRKIQLALTELKEQSRFANT